MNLKLKTSADGSHTLYDIDLDETYHSVHGAIQEAQHVFIKHGLRAIKHSESNIKIFEMGFGTGLNAFVTLLDSEKSKQHISYYGIESRPLNEDVWKHLNYALLLKTNPIQKQQFDKIHQCPWNEKIRISDKFELTKLEGNIEALNGFLDVDLIYFDAFGPRVQPNLWTQGIFQKMYNMLSHNGILVTYSAKGSVKRAMKNVGFAIEALEGPPGKREMTRAIKR